jgi:hypothetical protein
VGFDASAEVKRAMMRMTRQRTVVATEVFMLAVEFGKEKEKLEVDFMTVYCCPSCSLAFFNEVVQGPGLSLGFIEATCSALLESLYEPHTLIGIQGGPVSAGQLDTVTTCRTVKE